MQDIEAQARNFRDQYQHNDTIEEFNLERNSKCINFLYHIVYIVIN